MKKILPILTILLSSIVQAQPPADLPPSVTPQAPVVITPPQVHPPIPTPPAFAPSGQEKNRRQIKQRLAPSPDSAAKRERKKDDSSGIMSLDTEGKVNLDFIDVEISDIAKSISELTNRNFLIDDKVRGKISIISPKPVSVAEAYQAFISALEVKGFAVVPTGRVIKIVPLRNMKTLPIPTDTESAAGGDDIFVTRLAQIRYTNAGEIAKSLRGLISQNGDIISYDATNTLIITDNVGNLRRLLKIVDRLDQQGFQESIEIIKLKYAPAQDTTDKIIKIFNLQSQGGVAGQPPPGQPQGAQTNQYISKILPDERTNSIIVVANKEGISRVKDVVKQIDRSMEDQVGKGRIHVLYLQYADATELAGTLSGVSSGSRRSGGSSSRPTGGNSTIFPSYNTPNTAAPIAPAFSGGGGVNILGDSIKITADQQTNSLIIIASPTDYETLLPVIRRLDVRRPQAFVEAMILEVDIDKAFDVGIAGNVAGRVGGDDTALFAQTTFGGTSSIFLPSGSDSIQGLSAGTRSRTFDVPLGGGQSLTIPVFGGFFRALQTSGTVNVLSTPSILTRDNTEAEIVVGQVVPFITAQGRDVNNQPINQIQRENVAITLRVTPQINASEELTMDIFQEVQDLVTSADAATLGPTTSKRSARTSVLVKDSQTVTIGGLINDRISNSTSKVPILGDIPLLGWLFKSKTTSKRKTSLVIFLTPHIVREPDDLEELSIRKNTERQRFMEENNVKEHPGINKYEMDRELRVPATRKSAPVPADSPSGDFLAPLPAPTESNSTEEPSRL